MIYLFTHVHPLTEKVKCIDITNILVCTHSTTLYYIERDVGQWLEREALPLSLPDVQFRILLGSLHVKWYNFVNRPTKTSRYLQNRLPVVARRDKL